MTRGSRAVTIAVAEIGIAFGHRDLAANIWTNAGEASAGNVRALAGGGRRDRRAAPHPLRGRGRQRPLGSRHDNDRSPRWPCAVGSANVICVASTDRWDRLAAFSNFGVRSVDLAAPEHSILSTALDDSGRPRVRVGVGDLDGNAPRVGDRRTTLALRSTASVNDVRRALLMAVDRRASLAGRTVTGVA